ncbi:MAG: hypothetical protein ACKO7P_04025 [Bacteroidota bacterium]
MKKVFLMCVASAGLILASCGGEDKKSSESAKSTPEASGKGQNAEPQTACDCIKNVNNELNQFLKMSVQEIQKNPQFKEEFKLKIDKMMSTGKCADLMRNIQKEYATPEAFMKVCPEMKEMMETTQQLQNMGGQDGNEMDTTDF